MTIVRSGICLVMTLLLCAGLARADAPSEAELKAAFKERHDALVALKLDGKIGETAAGFVEAREASIGKDPDVRELLEAENRDRERLYELLSLREGSSPKDVGRQNAIFKFRKAADTEYFRGKDGVWRTKGAMTSE